MYTDNDEIMYTYLYFTLQTILQNFSYFGIKYDWDRVKKQRYKK